MSPIVPTLVLALTVGLAPAASAAPDTSPRDALEHEATRGLVVARQEQAQAFNPREHAARQGLATAGCTGVLAQAWSDLGHFSDGYESYLIRSGGC